MTAPSGMSEAAAISHARKPFRIAIVGGGFSGAVVALHLLKQQNAAGLDIHIVEPRQALGAGIAYGDSSDTDLVNVPAASLVIEPDAPDGFAHWLARRGGTIEQAVASFPSRLLLGRYVAERLDSALVQAGASLVHWRQTATAISRRDGQYRIGLNGNAGHIDADAVVIATGHEPAQLPVGLVGASGHPALFSNPHDRTGLLRVNPEASVLILGAGLTMADTVVALRARGHTGPIYVLSRRGLLPRERVSSPDTIGDFIPIAPLGSRRVLRAIRQEIARQQLRGRPWTDVLSAAREQNPAIWRAWSGLQKRAFLRHLKPFWDVHRFLLAPAVADRLRAERAAGLLTIEAGHVVNARPAGATIAVAIRPRGAGRNVVSVRHFAAVINCTGAGRADGSLANPLIASAVAAGLGRIDAFGLGLEADEAGRIVSVAGDAAGDFFVIGPPARSGLGETTGVPEIAAHAASIANRLIELARQRRPSTHASPNRPHVATAP
jgi:uncharacterized NAD(P)/FAD-binding protein YdhS